MALYKYNYEGKYKYIIQDWGDLEYCEQLEYQIDEWLKQFKEEEMTPYAMLFTRHQLYINTTLTI